MPTEQYIDIEQLLAPVSAEQPTGINFHNLRDADRNSAFMLLQYRNVDNAKSWQKRYTESWERGQERPVPSENQSWQKVIELATACLTKESKDVWVATYLLIALSYRHGFNGFQQGLQFLVQLIKLYGAQLYPNDKPFVELQRSIANLIQALNTASITDEAHGSRSRFDFVLATGISEWDLTQLEPYTALGTPLTDQLRHEIAETPAEHFVNIQQVIRDCEKALEDLEQELRTQFPNRSDYPNYEGIRKELGACRGLFAPYLKPGGAGAAKDSDRESAQSSSPSDSVTTSNSIVQERLDALRQLETIAAFFQRVEPLSPLPYLIRRAVDWGKKSLPEVLAELLSEEERIKLRDRVGIPLKDDSKGPAS